MTPLLSDLREPPVVGRWYMVPVVQNFPWYGRVRDWPVLGPLHEDAEFFNFDALHYHVDVRFVGARDAAYIRRRVPWDFATADDERDLAMMASAGPLNWLGRSIPTGRLPLKRLRCARATFTSPLAEMGLKQHAKMRERYGEPPRAILKSDGRKLCPHRKVDLSQFVPDADGVVTCPLHGLRVCVGAQP